MVRRLLLTAVLAGIIVTGLERSLPSGDLRDFGSFLASASAGASGKDPYGVYPLTFHVVVPGFDVWNPNLNPPVSVVFFRLFDRLDTGYAFRLWWSVSVLCYVAAIVLLGRRYDARRHWLVPLWAFAHAGLWDTLFLGQLYLPLVLMVAGSWLLLDMKRPLGAGVLMGIVIAFKPNLLVWPVLLVLARHWRAPAAAAVTATALILIPIATNGVDVYRQWLHVILSDDTRAAFLTNASFPGFAQRLGVGPVGALLAIGALAVGAGWAWRHSPEPLGASALGITLGIAASPIAWVHYTLFLLPVFFAQGPSRMLTGAAVLLVIPVPVVLHFLDTSLWEQGTIGSAYNWAVLLCLGGFAIEAASRPALSLARRSAVL